MKKLTKTIIASSFAVLFGTQMAQAVELNTLHDAQNTEISAEILNLMTQGNKTNSTIEQVVQLDQSDNYFFKLIENNNYYTMMYVRDLKTIVVKGDNTEIYDIKNQESVISKYENSIRKENLKKVNEESTIVYEGVSANSDIVYVFTDPTCGYCKKLHKGIESYNQENITVKYLTYPRHGTEGIGFDMAVNIQCAENQKEAMDYTKERNQPFPLKKDITGDELKACQDTVKETYNLGQVLGIRGTPAIYTINGEQVGGYVEASALRQVLNR